MTAFVGFFPGLFAKSAVVVVADPEAGASAPQALPFALRPDVRAVARRIETL